MHLTPGENAGTDSNSVKALRLPRTEHRSRHPSDERLFVCLQWSGNIGRLSSLKPRLAAVRTRIGFVERADLERARDLARDAEELTRRLYKTARWQRLRLAVLSRDLYTCRLCRRIEGNTAPLVCDHIEPHRGDVERFWAGPFQTLCKACHDGEKQRLERADRR